MIRLLPFAGIQVGVGQPYGTNIYGKIGYGIKTIPGEPQFQAAELREIEDEVPAHVYPLGTVQYGTGGVARGAVSIPIEGVRFAEDIVYAFEFVEDDTLPVAMRLTDTGQLICNELMET